MRTSFSTPPPSTLPISTETERSATASQAPVGSNLRVLGQNAVLDTAAQEVLTSVPMQRDKRRPAWAASTGPSQLPSSHMPSASAATDAARRNTWSTWNVNGATVAVRDVSGSLDMHTPGAQQAFASLSLLSPRISALMANNGFSLIAVRKSVVEFEPGLAGHTAGGNKSTWDKIPCCHSHDKKALVFSTDGNYTGCYDSILHELFHAVDDTSADRLSNHHAFIAAYKADEYRILADYFLQNEGRGKDGKQEVFAEAGARYLACDPLLPKELPAVFNYFNERYHDDRAFASHKMQEIQFQPTSAIYAHRMGYRSIGTRHNVAMENGLLVNLDMRGAGAEGKKPA